MPIVNVRELMFEAARDRYAVGAFTVTNLVQMEGVVDAAVERRSPVIIQVSAGTARFLGANVLVAITDAIACSAPVPMSLHLDHCTEVEYCQECADQGFTNVMIDAARQPYAENVRQTRAVADYCHTLANIPVEGRLDTWAGIDQGDPQLADPRQALEFVEATGLDMFAPAIGTAHGGYKPSKSQIDLGRLVEINRLLNGDAIRTPLVIHGGTLLSEDYVGRLIEAGGAKFNISAALSRTLIDAQADYLLGHRNEYEPAKIDIAIRDAVRKVAGRWMEMLGSVGKA